MEYSTCNKCPSGLKTVIARSYDMVGLLCLLSVQSIQYSVSIKTQTIRRATASRSIKQPVFVQRHGVPRIGSLDEGQKRSIVWFRPCSTNPEMEESCQKDLFKFTPTEN